MKRILLYLGVLIALYLLPVTAFGALNITYTSPGAFTLGTAITTISPTVTGGTVTAGGFSPIYSFYTITDPWDVTVDASGNVYTISETGNTVVKITPTGAATTIVTAYNAMSNPNGVSNPTGIAIDALGNIYVCNFGLGTVTKYNTSGTWLSTITGFSQPYGISFDSSNNAYIADAGTNDVYKITAGTTSKSVFASAFNGAYGTAVDPSGNLYVSEYLGNDVIKITPGNVRTTFATAFNTTLFNGPRQLGSDASGNIYVADYGNNAVYEISQSGVVSAITGATGLNTPRSIQTDAAGSIYIADYGGGEIAKIAVTGYIISAPLPAGLSFNTSTGKITGTPLVTFASTVYSIIAYNATGKSNTTTITLSCTQTTLDWKGTTSAWATTTNWTPNGTPNQYTAVRIGSNATFTTQPTLSANTIVSSVTFGTTKTATLTIAAGDALTINNSLIVNTGGATPTITGTATSGVNMAPGSIVSISGTSKLTITTLPFTLQSTAAGDASIGQITATSIVGTVTVQRYLSAERSYRLLSSPVEYSTTVPTDYSINYIKNDAFLTGTDGTTGGFDKAGNPTLYLYRESLTTGTNASFISGNFRGVQNIAQTPAYDYLINNETGQFAIPIGNGVLFFFRGSRSTANPYTVGSPALASTLATSGPLNAGQITVKNWYTGAATLSYTAASPVAGLNLVGNPYASAINWDTFQTASTTTGIYGTNGTNGVSNAMYVLDPVTENFGSYIAGSGGIGSATFVSNIISSGQGFFVVAGGTGDKLIFNESAKTTTQNTGATLLMGTPVNYANNQYIRLWMGQSAAISDQTMIRFNSQATLAYASNSDAVYKTGYGQVSLASRSSDKFDLAIKTAPLPKLQPERIGLDVKANTDGVYNLTLQDIVAVPQLFDVWLMDKYKNDSLDMRQNKTYAFNVYQADTASFGPNRFSLVIRQNTAYAYQLLSFTAAKIPNAKQVQITWKTVNEGNYTNFTVERSIDAGKTFDVLGGVGAAGAGQYGFLDSNPALGKNLYRLEQQDINGTITYSAVVQVEYSGLSNSIAVDNLSIYPNPVSSTINLAIAQQASNNVSSFDIRFMNSFGMMVKEVTSSQTSWQGNLADLQPGIYFVKVLNTKNDALVGQSKFVKL